MMEELLRYSRAVFTPRRKESVTQWAERELVIPTGPHAGSPFRVRNAPYMEFILDLLGEAKTRKISLKWSTQVGKSLTMLIGMAWQIVNDPSTSLYIADNAGNARSVSKNQFQPFLDSSPELAAITPQKNKEEKITNLEMSFENSALLYWVGAQSTSSLSGKAVKWLFVDEIRSYKTEGGKEADSLSLALNRTKSYPSSKTFLSSSPTTKNEGISKHHAEGSCHEYRLPCPHCKKMQVLDFDNLKWEGKNEDESWNKNEVKKTTHYSCNFCKKKITEAHKTKMLREGEWIQTNFDALEGDYSFHLSSLYSLQISWGDIAVKFIEAKSSPTGLQDFRQNMLSLDWIHFAEEKRDINSLKALKLDYPLGESKSGQTLMSVDVQGSTLKYSVRTFEGEKSYLIDRGEVITWDSIREIETKYNVESVIADSGGNRTRETYEEIFKNPNWIAAKGRATTQMPEPFSLVPHFDPFTGSRNQGRYTIRFLHINNEIWQSYLQECLGGKKQWYLPEYIDEEYLRELTNEAPIEVTNKAGVTKTVWQKIGTNDFRDCEKYLLALRSFLNPKPKGAPERKRRPQLTGFSL